MMEKMKTRLIISLLALLAPAFGQTFPPNQEGVALGHFHLAVRDIDAQTRFWTAIGGVPVDNGPLKLIQFPGVYIMLRKAEPNGGTVGSTVNHIGFFVKSMPESLAKWEAAGLKIEKTQNPQQAYLIAPDDIRLEMIEDASIPGPIASRHIHFHSASALDMQAWYVKMFGAKPVDARGNNKAAEIPGANLTFSKDDMNPAGTKGRSLDHIGFEVKNQPEFIKKLEAAGVKLDQPYNQVPNSKVATAFLTDPWGTYIELTEGLDPK